MKRMLWKAAALALACCLTLAGSVAYASFSDVKAGKWYAGAVTEMEASGLLKGYSDGTFRPNRTISAAEFVTIVGRCSGKEEGTGQTGHWAAGWLQTGLEAGWYDWDEIPPTGERFDLLFYVQPDKQEQVRKALHMLKEIPFRFETSGARILYYASEFYTIPGEEVAQKC